MGKRNKLSLEQFRALKIPDEVQAVLSRVNGGSLMECHKLLFAATGIWMPELVPIFQKMDALLMTRDLPANLQ
jgi:hypothetical protein